MDFVELDRLFVPLKRDADAALELGPNWGLEYGGWLDWPGILQRWRVALLAEALSGKTKELEHQAVALRREGKPAFFLRIEDLADDSFEASLNDDERAAFHSWAAADAGEAWFFLDSVDEARLNGKKLATALRNVRAALFSGNLNRAHIIVSCRVSDWRGKADRESLQKELPYVPPAEPLSAVTDPDEILLSPMFDRTSRSPKPKKPQTEPDPSELLVVQLAPLTHEQQARMATAASITNVPEFMQAVRLSGLETMSERPGDLIDLIGYWREHGKFGSLEEMTEEGVKRKLREEDIYRPEAGMLSQERARRGAERLAAALILAKTFTIKAPGQDADPTLAKGALESRDVLPEWDPDSISALLRTGLFAPGTYGRIRFHHRFTQEYLAACWLRWLTQWNNCPIAEVHALLFVDPYGVPTVVPTLRAVAAWLSLWFPSVREKVVNREPASLIIHGDPKSLPLEIRERLLGVYAALDSRGDLNVERIDYRAAWMFSSPSLARAVRSAWEANDRREFRMHLLEFIEGGHIKECVDLAREIALDSSENRWHRLNAARALLACDDRKGLSDLARVVRAAPDRLGAQIAPQLASLLYPAYLSTDDILDLVDRSEFPESYQSEGFSDHLVSLHALAPTRDAQRQFVLGIADLILKAHRIDDTEISNRHIELGKGVAALAKAELERRAIGDVDDGLIRLLMATERARGAQDDENEPGAIAARVHRDKVLNRQLMWADAQTERKDCPKEADPVTIWQVAALTGFVLWRADISDLEWLQEDARRMPKEYERRIAFSAILSALHRADLSESQREFLDRLAAGDAALQADLTDFRKPAPVDPYVAQAAARNERAAKMTQEAKKSWTDFRDKLKLTPDILDAPESVTSWKAGLHRLYDLTKWIDMKARYDGVEGAAKWQALPLAFGSAVAEHYARAMLMTWRKVRPERPKKIADNQFTRKNSNELALSAVELDSLTLGWEHNLSDDEVAIAMRHACFAGTIRAKWVNRLVTARPNAALPEITSAVATEYRSNGTYSNILISATHTDTPALQAIATEVFRLLRKSEPVDDATLDRSVQVLRRGIAGLPAPQARSLVLKRMHLHLDAANEKRAVQYLGALAAIDPEELAKIVLSKLERGASEADQDYAKRVSHWLGVLFAGHGEHGVATAALAKVPIAHLARLLRLAYAYIPARDWTAHRSGSGRSPSDKAESARGRLFNAIAERPGAEAYEALLALTADPVFADSSLRLREIAHARAEADGDLPTWLATEVSKFEQSHSAPVKTGAQLLTLTLGVLADIEASFTNADASSRQLLALAQDEEEVQGWLAERLNERARGRYSAAREPEVADRNEPDILVSSTSADVQVAIEVKNGNKKWTVTQLEGAVRGQLAKDYLRPANRRYGLLVVSLHRRRIWRVLGEEWDFARLIEHLKTVAQATRVNDSGPVQVAVVGINSSHETPSLAKRPSRKRLSET